MVNDDSRLCSKRAPRGLDKDRTAAIILFLLFTRFTFEL